MIFKTCYRCGREAKFFSIEGLFYEDVSYWYDRTPVILNPKGFSFVCEQCVLTEMLISKLAGFAVIIMDRIDVGYDRSNLPVDKWIEHKFSK